MAWNKAKVLGAAGLGAGVTGIIGCAADSSNNPYYSLWAVLAILGTFVALLGCAENVRHESPRVGYGPVN